MEEGLNLFSIKDLENFSGIKAHTIRIWEKRYNLLAPERTDSNIRTYNESELKKILNVAYLNRNGYKISKIAKLDEDELNQRVMAVHISHDNPDKDFDPGKILMSAIRFNEELFRETLLPYIKYKGIEEAYCRYFHPLLQKTRILWQTGSLSRAQDQFIRNTISEMITVEDSQLRPTGDTNRKTVAMINTDDILSDINFHFYKYVLKKRGFDVIYTGGLLPASEVIEIFKIKPFDYLIVNSGGFDFSKKKTAYFSNIAKSLMIKKVILTDYPDENEKRLQERLVFTGDPAGFIDFINTLR